SDLWADSYRKLHTGDFNGDGKTDLLLQNRYPDYHHTYLLNGTSTGFSNADAITTQYGMNYALWAADNMVLQVGDFTSKYVSDHMDILLIARPGRSSYILKNKGNGFFKTHVALP
ncbi:MAG: FG-GAP repeat protein, partial [Candidatus Thermoplasmatota archaeon]|nr:FG-GAP repeat protein [Candidatus Thermoplasmatota archaeon]